MRGIRILDTSIHLVNMRTRMPFRYGIATMTTVPHALVQVELEIDGARQRGLSADHLPPLWFTKDPDRPYRQQVADMLAVIRSAGDLARALGDAPSPFAFWRELYTQQTRWAQDRSFPALLSHFGVSLVERALIEAFCRGRSLTLTRALQSNALGIRFEQVHPELEEVDPADLLPGAPASWVSVRHTVGLSDPLTDAEIAPDERLDDGLPQSLEASIRGYGLTHFKIKIGGDPDGDAARLARVAEVIQRNAGPDYAVTLDGNEQYRDLALFRALWTALAGSQALRGFLARVLFVEQPMHREVALSPATRQAILDWHDRPPLVIDESDAELESLPRALECGYVGTSHKNCKGIFKGLSNAALLRVRDRRDPVRRLILSAEDLSNVGPVALMQDLAVLAALGIPHAERNGHHYFAGLSMWPSDIQDRALEHHGDLYGRHERGFPALKIREGRLELGSVLAAPFGVGFELDPSRFPSREEWSFESL